MLEFRKGPYPPNYRSRRQQGRLFVMVAAMVAILWVAFEARDPGHYRWIWNLGRAGGGADSEVDTRFVPPGPSEDDSFVFPLPSEEREAADRTVLGGLTEADLAAVRDDEPLRAAEAPAWFKLFDRLQKADEADLRGESIGAVTFIQLFRQPKEYRGELVTLAGTLRRSEKVTARQNDAGIDSYYRTWLFPRDNPGNPIVVYVLTMPKGFPEGMAIERQVELEGYFFKRWPYAAEKTMRSAPIVLAKSLRQVSAGPKAPPRAVSPITIVAVAAAAAASFVAVVWWQTRRARRGAPVPGLFRGQIPDDAGGDAGRLKRIAEPAESDGKEETP